MTGSLRHPAVDAALSTAATLLGMEVVFIGGLDEDTFRFDRVHGSMPGLDEGMESERTDSFCHRMLGGAPCTTDDAARDGHYADAPIRAQLGIASYVGVPIRRADGAVFGTLCGIDRRNVSVDDATVGVLRELAGIISAHLPGDDTAVVIRRTPDGWHVGESGDPSDDLTTAMVLADLLQADLEPGGRPDRGDPPADELAKLRVAVTQLEHALAARVTVEQAIGVLTERLGVPPRDAFERLRKVARRGGRRVHDLSRDVVRSATQPVDLPDELRAP